MRQYHEMVFWPILYSCSFIAYYPKKKNWNPDWYIKWIGDWPSVSTLVFRPENPPSLFCGNPPPFIEHCPAWLRKNGATQLYPQHCWMFPPTCTKSWLCTVNPTTFRHTTQILLYTSVVVWNLFCDWNSDRQVSCCRNLRRFKQNNNHDIYTTH